jgi:hypothetical protein
MTSPLITFKNASGEQVTVNALYISKINQGTSRTCYICLLGNSNEGFWVAEPYDNVLTKWQDALK